MKHNHSSRGNAMEVQDNKTNRNVEVQKQNPSFLTEEEEIDFRVSLDWVISHTKELMEELQLAEAFSLLGDFLQEWQTRIWKGILTEILHKESFLQFLKRQAAHMGYHYVGRRKLKIILPNGVQIKIFSPYFVRINKKKAVKRKALMGEVVI